VRICSFAILAHALGGCASGEDPAAPLPLAPSSVAATGAAPAASQPKAAPSFEMAGEGLDEEADSPTLDPELGLEDSEDGFCADDIYTTYLKSQYRSANPAQAFRRAGDEDAAAHTHARKRLVGPTAPYFGAIPIVANERVDRWVQYFKTSGRREFMKWLVRGESVRRMVQPILQDNGIPIEFFYLAMVESGFSNRAYSHKRATGTWQFMPATARNYGLRINHWVDERRDPIKSTIAASNYLRDLYDQLGDWYLTMAAYNAGPGKVRRAMRAARTRDFWTIARTPYLAKETKSYVPKVLAAVLLASDMRAHGFDVTETAPEWIIPDTEVVVKRPIQLDQLATLLQVPTKALRAWNPELIQNVTPPGRDGYALRLAPTLAMRFQEVEPQLSQLKLSDVQEHTIQTGETLRAIAKRYKVGIREIMSLNPKLQPERLRIGHTVTVPVPSVVTVAPDKA
jgi:membrane-bound lytic murein transglycosylase D